MTSKANRALPCKLKRNCKLIKVQQGKRSARKNVQQRERKWSKGKKRQRKKKRGKEKKQGRKRIKELGFRFSNVHDDL